VEKVILENPLTILISMETPKTPFALPGNGRKKEN
jgi:hypothetical protein